LLIINIWSFILTRSVIISCTCTIWVCSFCLMIVGIRAFLDKRVVIRVILVVLLMITHHPIRAFWSYLSLPFIDIRPILLHFRKLFPYHIMVLFFKFHKILPSFRSRTVHMHFIVYSCICFVMVLANATSTRDCPIIFALISLISCLTFKILIIAQFLKNGLTSNLIVIVFSAHCSCASYWCLVVIVEMAHAFAEITILSF